MSSSLSVDVPRCAVKKPIPAMKESLLRDALIARKVTPVKSTAPSKKLHTELTCVVLIVVGVFGIRVNSVD